MQTANNSISFKTIQTFLQQGDVDIFYEDFVGYGLMHRHQSTEIEVVLAAIEEMKVRVHLVFSFTLGPSSHI